MENSLKKSLHTAFPTDQVWPQEQNKEIYCKSAVLCKSAEIFLNLNDPLYFVVE